ncbi:hypothetical protein Tco_0572948 [Tanacetum coccineum]
MTDDACQCKGTCVLNVRFGVCYILDLWFLCCEYGHVVTYRQILLSRVKRLMEFKPIVNASLFRIWLEFSELNDIVVVVGDHGIIDWYDPLMCPRPIQIIPGLLRSMNDLQGQLQQTSVQARRTKMMLVFS